MRKFAGRPTPVGLEVDNRGVAVLRGSRVAGDADQESKDAEEPWIQSERVIHFDGGGIARARND